MTSIDADSSYSRFSRLRVPTSRTPAKPTPVQKALEWTLFTVFGCTLVLAGVALYATNRPEHRMVPNRVSAGLTSDRVNVLLIGSSARSIESLMILSIQPTTGRAALMSFPVDLWVKVGRYGQRPLRAAYSLGESAGYPGAGTGLTVDTIEDIIDEPVHAYARFSIGDVQRLVDKLDGLEIDVKHGIYDYRAKDRYRPGQQHVNGARAIRYAYSRSMAGLPASNRFAREQRQQDVILGVMSKAMSTREDVDTLEPVFGSLAETNLTSEDSDALVAALRRGEEIRRISFAPYLDSFDVTSVAYRGEAVRPRSGNFATLQKIADAALDTGVARVH